MILARENRAEEHSPWAIIIVREALHPHLVLDIVPATNSPMCPTLE